ncbi:hypothetical protein Salat_2197300 [Sesamum alatum]|uniref:Uncharacterized protein n=1 Tax=Sesamum alatum TaxID=300844 RepID=A0AAE2CD87_9LAMI|nr:hypothetical protein Salat_2197300 [Sesamum alatum]
MKREGRQHGMVRTYPVLSTPSPRCRHLNELSCPPTAGQFTKVSTKPTNHSKFTGKCCPPMCYRCHSRPVSKSMDKAKGAQKIRSGKVGDATPPGLKLTGFSATTVLDYIDRDHSYEADHNDDADINNVEDSDYHDNYYQVSYPWIQIIEEDHHNIDDGINEDAMSFCEAPEDGNIEDWWLVDEM